ncbi:MAG: hypothetical protein V1774_08530, partial [Candidatus Eisenbacteria bacterium]
QRRAEQLALLQEDLLAREQRWAGQAQALSAPAFSWRRQATAALGTVILTLAAVAGALKLGLGWSAWQKRLRGEELRLRKLQLSVLGALEELQAAIAQARDDVSAAAPRAAGFTALEAPPAPLQAEYSDPPAEWAERLVGRPVETRPARLVGRPVESRAVRLAGRPMEPSPARPAGRPVETRPARPSARPVETRPDRFVARPAELGPASEGGPWMEPPARDAERPAPRQRPAPPWMGRVEELAAEGLTAAEIGRRLRVSREEILLALARRSRERKLDRESGTAEAARIRAAALPQGRGE